MIERTLTAIVIVLTFVPLASAQSGIKELIRDYVYNIDHDAAGDPLKKPHDRSDVQRLGLQAPTPVWFMSPTWFEVINGNKEQVSATFTATASAVTDVEIPGAGTDSYPDMILINNWLHVNGVRPVVGTRAVIANAEGSVIGLEILSGKHRVSYLEGDPDHFVWVWPRPADNRKPAILTVGSYVEAEVNGNGDFVTWIQANPAPHGRPRPNVILSEQLDEWKNRLVPTYERFLDLLRKSLALVPAPGIK